MKKILLGISLISSLFVACNKAPQTQPQVTESDSTATTGLRLAYIQLDTLMNQYQMYKDYSEIITRKGTNIQNTLAQKQRALEEHAAALQKKYESNGFTTRDELERAQQNLQKEQMDFQALAERLNNEFNLEQARYNDEALDSIQAFVNAYNKTAQYDYVMIKTGANMLIANPKYDITDDVVKGLNARYNKKSNKKELKKMGE